MQRLGSDLCDHEITLFSRQKQTFIEIFFEIRFFLTDQHKWNFNVRQ